jgi:hypothetical protein
MTAGFAGPAFGCTTSITGWACRMGTGRWRVGTEAEEEEEEEKTGGAKGGIASVAEGGDFPMRRAGGLDSDQPMDGVSRGVTGIIGGGSTNLRGGSPISMPGSNAGLEGLLHRLPSGRLRVNLDAGFRKGRGRIDGRAIVVGAEIPLRILGREGESLRAR